MKKVDDADFNDLPGGVDNGGSGNGGDVNGTPNTTVHYVTGFYSNPLNYLIDPAASRCLNGTYYSIQESFSFQQGNDDSLLTVLVPAGYLTTMTTSPRWVWSIFRSVGLVQAAVLHNYLTDYLKINVGGEDVAIKRQKADSIFKAALTANGANTFQRNFYYWCARLTSILGGHKGPQITPTKRALEHQRAETLFQQG